MNEPLAATPVSVAVVEHAGCYLVGTRPADVPLAGYSEFPGGKCLSDESPLEAAERECYEETGLSVVARGLRLRITHAYDHGTVVLHFVDCAVAGSASGTEPRPPYRWVPAAQLVQCRFPLANRPVVEQLIAAATARADRPR
ncbi:MAG: NUDIX domain-containing protein [Pirellulales bacterium]